MKYLMIPLLLFHTVALQATDIQSKGVGGICPLGVDCLSQPTLSINAQTHVYTNIIQQNIEVQQQHEGVKNIHLPTIKSVPDVEVRFRSSGAEDNGRVDLLGNHQVLKSCDRFTVFIKAHKDIWLYLYHFDGHNELNELVSWSNTSNLIKAGTELWLPNEDYSFQLDETTGIETIHTIISENALTELNDKYLNQLLQRGSITELVSKGVMITPVPVVNTTSRVVVCPAGINHCRDSFHIKHVAGTVKCE